MIPQASIDRLREIGDWTKINGEAIYGTKAGPFDHLAFGCCTQKSIDGGVRLYLHIFNWPADGKLRVPGLFNKVRYAYLLADSAKKALGVDRSEDSLIIAVPNQAPDRYNSVVVADLVGAPDVTNVPEISADADIFVGDINVTVTSNREDVAIHYTVDGSVPTNNSFIVKGSIQLQKTTVVSARCFRDGVPVSGTSSRKFRKVVPKPAVNVLNVEKGIHYGYYVGNWDSLPDFKKLEPVSAGILPNIDIAGKKQNEYFGFSYTGYINISKDGVYTFYMTSDDGSRLFLDDTLIVDNDGLHGMNERKGVVALAAGMHPLRIEYFQKSGGVGLVLSYKGPGTEKQVIPDAVLFTDKR